MTIETRVDDLPEERGTMSAREALAQAIAWLDGRAADYANDAPEVREMCRLRAGHAMATLNALGFGIYQLHPEPKVT